MQLWLPVFVAILYLIAGITFFANTRGKTPLIWALFSLFLACQLHALSLFFSVSSGESNILNLSIINVISIFAWTISCLSFIWLWKPEMALGGVMIGVINAILILVSACLHSNKPFLHNMPTGMIWHILLSIAAWTVLSIAVIHGVLYLYIYYRLKKKKLRNLQMASLASLERLTMLYVVFGLLLLLLSLLSGWMFVDNLFAQHLWHKTVLTMSAAAAYIAVVFTYFYQRRDTITVVYWSFIGYALLAMGYVASNVILQFVVNKR